MKWLCTLGCALALVGLAAQAQTPPPAPSIPASDLEIVESVPTGTIYGEPGVRRTQAVWLAMIQHAQRSIDIAAFYIADKPHEALAPVLNALAARARSGVKVRILVDESFLKDNPHGVDRLRKVPGIDIRPFAVKTLTGGVLHAKYMVVDNATVFVGSANWDWRALDQIHEIGARVANARFAQTFEAAFDVDWHEAALADMPKIAQLAQQPLAFAPVTRNDPAVLNKNSADPVTAFPAFSPPALTPQALSTEQTSLVQMINQSRQVLRIQVMTLSAIKQYGLKGWWPAIDGALRDAAARGVSVQIIVADWALQEPMQAYLKSLAVLPGITVKFSQLPASSKGFIPYARVEHAKYAVADDRAIYIGTGNWEWSYFNTTVDASVFAHGTQPAKTLTRIFNRDWNGPYVTVLEPGKTYQAPRTH